MAPRSLLRLLAVPALLTSLQVGCNAPPNALRNAQLRSMQLHQQNVHVAMDRDRAHQQLASLHQRNQALAAENQQLAQRADEIAGDLDIAHRRLNNLAAERTKLQDRYVSLLKKKNEQESPLSPGTTRRFEDLARRYPDFEFDPQTGVSKFHADILFDSGRDVVKTQADELLREFAAILNEDKARQLNILVVGHTDDEAILHPLVKAKHPTNWHLSTNRADAVIVKLAELGIADTRMGAAGYSMYQPVATNDSDAGRQMNRRVEIYVLAPDAVIAGWDPVSVERR